jgi:hypothetical protein
MEIIVGLPIAFLTLWYLIPKQTRVNFWLIIFDLFTDHFDAGGDRGTVTRSAPFTDEDIESALRKREDVLKRSELLDAIPVVKDMSNAAKAAVITPQSVKRDSIEERPGVFAFQVDTTEKLKEREGILN